MRKLILACVSGVALMGLAACSDNADGTTTQALPPDEPVTTQPEMPAAPAPVQPAQPLEPAAPVD